MPTYAYVCTACDHRFEIVQAITDETLAACPECGGTLRKVFHPVGVAFKGSGFYRTDSRTSEGKAKTGSEVAAKAESKGKDASSSSSGSDKKSSSESKSTSTTSKPTSSSSSGSGSGSEASTS